MDQKKTLWIIAAVGAFLLAVIGTALILYSPEKKQASVAKAPVQIQAPVDTGYSNGWTNELTAPSQQLTAPAQTVQQGFSNETSEMIVFSDNTTVLGLTDSQESAPKSTTIDLNTLKQELALDQYARQLQAVQPQTPQNINITVNLPETTVTLNESQQKVITNDYYVAAQESSKNNVSVAVTVPEQKSEPAFKPHKENKKSAAVSEPAKPAVTVTETKTTTKVSTPAPVVTSTPKAVTQYWVQVAAYGNKKGAETARAVLDENKIPADVFTYEDNKARLFYRVRVGPYTTKSEAEYWRTKIIKIDEFSKAESFVTSTTN